MPLSINQTDLPALLPNQGDFVILQHTASGGFELQHRSRSLAIVTTPIERQPVPNARGPAEYIYVFSHPDWSNVLSPYYNDLEALSRALQDRLGLHDVAGHAPVLLNTSLPTLPPAPTKPAQDYALTAQEQVIRQLIPLLTRVSTIGESEVMLRLARSGDFLILALPDNGGFELRHRSRNGQTVSTPIHVGPDPIAPERQRFSISRPAWPTVHLRSYASLQLLSADLIREVSLSPASSRIPLTLLPSSSPGAHSPVTQPDSLLQQAGRATLDAWQQRFQEDAWRYLAQRVRQESEYPALPLLPRGSSIEQVMPALLANSRGLVVGEADFSGASRRFLIEQLPSLAEQGVRTLFLGALSFDGDQAALDHFFDTGEVNRELQQQLERVDTAAGTPEGEPREQYSLRALLQAARSHDIQPLGIDAIGRSAIASQAEPLHGQLTEFTPSFWQKQASLYIAQLVINQQQQQSPDEKWVALVDSALVLHTDQQNSLAELTNSIAVRVSADSLLSAPHLTLDPGSVSTRLEFHEVPSHNEVARGRHFELLDGWNWADFVLSDQPPESAFERNIRLERTGDYLLLRDPGGNTMKKLRRAKGGKIETIPGSLLIGQDLHSDLPERFRPPQAPAELALARQQLDARFALLRESRLMQLSVLASAEQQAEFKAGHAQYLEELPRVGLERETDLATMKQLFTDPGLFRKPLPIPPKATGTIMRAIHELQAQKLLAQNQLWQTQMEKLGGSAITTMNHNLYLAQAERSRGVCSALSAQLAAAWLLDHANPAARGEPIEYYLQRFTSASRDSSSDSARIFGLGLLAWSYNEPQEKFANHSAVNGLDPEGCLRILDAAPATTAYELSFTDHALSIGVAVYPDNQRHYYLADPNYGYSEYASSSACLQGLQLQHQLLRLQAANDNGFSLREYRSDLSQQALFPQRLGHMDDPNPLTLAELCGENKLAGLFNPQGPLEQNRWFNKLRKHLTITEYRVHNQIPGDGGLQVGSVLAEILVPFVRNLQRQTNYLANLASNDLLSELARSKLLTLSLHEQQAQVRFITPENQPYDLRLDLSTSEDDLRLMQRYQAFWQRVSESQSETGRWQRLRQMTHGIQRKLQRGVQSLNIDTLYLAAALPQDKELSENIMRILRGN